MEEYKRAVEDNIYVPGITLENRLEIIEEGLRKKYLSRLTEMKIARDYLSSYIEGGWESKLKEKLEDDLIDNVRLYHILKMVYKTGESITDKFTTVFHTLSPYKTTAFILLDSDGKKTDFYVGVRNNETDEERKRSTVTVGETLKSTLTGQFPGIRIDNIDREKTQRISEKIFRQKNVASVSIVGEAKSSKDRKNEEFIQGLEKLALTMQGRKYMAIIMAENLSLQGSIQTLRKEYQDLYTDLSVFRKVQLSGSASDSKFDNKSFFELNGEQKEAMIGGTIGAAGNHFELYAGIGAMLGSFIGVLAPGEQKSNFNSSARSTNSENKAVTDLMKYLDNEIRRTDEFDSYGIWGAAGYFISDDMPTVEIAASNYRSLMNGETSGREISAINFWRKGSPSLNGRFEDLISSLSRFTHPRFIYGQKKDDGFNTYVSAAATISGKELGIHLGFPRASIAGLPVLQHAEFGKDIVYDLQNAEKAGEKRPDTYITLGRLYDMGRPTEKRVTLDKENLVRHAFVTGTTGSGKSTTVYKMLTELHQIGIPFLVVEPAKGEYKDEFGNWPGVKVFSTNPSIAPLLQLNPFEFPESIHVLEHIDGLVEIFNACWTMYDAMPALFKKAILRSYESIGWDLCSSVFEGRGKKYPSFQILVDQLIVLIDESGYSAEVKSNYRGALVTRAESLTVGLNKLIFTDERTPYRDLFDRNCILDISRMKSMETKSLIMGLMVYILNEYRMHQKTGSDESLKHVTVLEEAHNLLKNTSMGQSSELVRKSVEMLTQTIAEIRTYGESFIIVDQSPSSVDIAAIKNTNTKIIHQTLEVNDRETVGRSIGLDDDQMNEISKLPTGVAVVYQNDWMKPVLTKVERQKYKTKSAYINKEPEKVKLQREVRTELISVLMQPWLKRARIRSRELEEDLRLADLRPADLKKIRKYADYYTSHRGSMRWEEADIPKLRDCLKAVLQISEKEMIAFSAAEDDGEVLQKAVRNKTEGFSDREIEEICFRLSKI